MSRVRRWSVTVVYVTLVAAVGAGAWRHDQANAGRVAELDKQLTTCQTPTPYIPGPRPVFFD